MEAAEKKGHFQQDLEELKRWYGMLLFSAGCVFLKMKELMNA